MSKVLLGLVLLASGLGLGWIITSSIQAPDGASSQLARTPPGDGHEEKANSRHEPVANLQQGTIVEPVSTPVRATPRPSPPPSAAARSREAETRNAYNKIYEAAARESLPTLSVQTHNPVWALQTEDGDVDGLALPAPEVGEFGRIQPPEGEIWLRIPPDNANEFEEVLARHADLYRQTTGDQEPVTVLLWVGGRPFARRTFEDR